MALSIVIAKALLGLCRVFLSMPLNNNLTTNSSKYGKDSSKNRWSVHIPLI
jgi:hypothetical protein